MCTGGSSASWATCWRSTVLRYFIIVPLQGALIESMHWAHCTIAFNISKYLHFQGCWESECVWVGGGTLGLRCVSRPFPPPPPGSGLATPGRLSTVGHDQVPPPCALMVAFSLLIFAFVVRLDRDIGICGGHVLLQCDPRFANWSV